MVRGGQSDKKRQSLRADERAIEGLPIRLIIALFVGLVALGLMLQVLGLFDTGELDRSEITVDVQEGSTIDLDTANAGDEQMVFQVVNGDGSVIDREEYDTVLLEPDTAQGETATLDSSQDDVSYDSDAQTWNVSFEFFNKTIDAGLTAGQNTGSYQIEPQGATEFDEAVPVEMTLID